VPLSSAVAFICSTLLPPLLLLLLVLLLLLLLLVVGEAESASSMRARGCTILAASAGCCRSAPCDVICPNVRTHSVCSCMCWMCYGSTECKCKAVRVSKASRSGYHGEYTFKQARYRVHRCTNTANGSKTTSGAGYTDQIAGM
jgi:hypothetical protein